MGVTCRASVVAWVALVVLLLGTRTTPGDTSKGPLYTCTFDGGAAGWKNADDPKATLNTGPCPADSGREGTALIVPVAFPGQAGISLKRGLRWNNAYTLQALVFVPFDAPDPVQVTAYIVDAELRWYQSTLLFEPVKGRWSTFRASISAESVEWAPVNHFKPWSSQVTRDVTEFGFKFFSKEPWSGNLLVDEISVLPKVPPTTPLRILNFRTNLNSVPRYEKLEIAFTLSREYDNPFNPEEVDVTGQFIAPNGEVFVVPAFFYQDYKRRLERNWEILTPVGGSEWRLRFAPTREGEYRYTIRVNDGEKLITETRRFNCIASDNKGYIRVSNRDPQYFEFENGEFFYPIGHNIPATFNMKAAEILGVQIMRFEGTFAYDLFLKGMASAGENFARLWMAAWSFGLEWSPSYDIHYRGLGRYNLENAWRLDYVLEQARRKGIYLQVALTTFGHYRSESFEGDWPYSPYNMANGGFIDSRAPAEFWSNERAQKYYRQMLRYVMARWGYSTTVASWELCNEVDMTTNYERSRPAIVKWHDECADVIRRYDQGRHLLTANFAIWGHDPEIIRLSCISYTSSNRYETNEINAMDEVYRAKSRFKKPALMVECGEDFKGSAPATTERYIPICIWSSYMMPFAGAGMQWWWDFIEERNLYFYFKPLVLYAKGEDRRGKNLQIAWANVVQSSDGKPIQGLAARCLKNKSEAFAWVYETRLVAKELDRPLNERQGADLTLSDMNKGTYRVEFWDTIRGGRIGEQTVKTVDDTIRFALPKFQDHIAVKVKPDTARTE
jgi:hypothetical protein